MTGAINVSATNAMKRSVDTSFMEFFGGTTYKNGAYIRLDGKDGPKTGNFTLASGDGTTNISLIGTPSGGLTWNNKNVVCVSTWRSGDSWYRKYSDGWIEQGGRIERAVTVTVTFHQAYSSVPTILSGCVYNRASTFYAREVYPNTATTTNFTITNTVPAGATTDHIRWYACGY